MDTEDKVQLMSELRQMAVEVYGKEGLGVHAKLLARAINALEDEAPRLRAALATELDLLAITNLSARERELVAKTSELLRIMSVRRGSI